MTEFEPTPPPLQPAVLVEREQWQAHASLKRAIGNTLILASTGQLDSNGAADNTMGVYSEDQEFDSYQSVMRAYPSLRDQIAGGEIEGPASDLLEAWPEFVDTLKSGTKTGVDTGYIPARIELLTDTALDETGLRSVGTSVRSVTGFVAAYYESDSDDIGVFEDMKELGDNYVENLVHEYSHKMSGGTFRLTEPESATYDRKRVGFGTEMKLGRYSKTGLNEAMIQHMTMGILTGDFETLDPDSRPDGNRSYYSYRKAVAAFIDDSQGIIDLKTITNALYEDTAPGGGVQERRKMVQETVRAYGPGALTKLDKLCEAANIIPEGRVAELVADVILPPVLDSEGRVLQVGFIDTTKLDFMKLRAYFPSEPLISA
jgi:hypothetical protein